ncbi:MAG: hypothetical protein AAGC96_21510 [Pseudomonadota bacterium]
MKNGFIMWPKISALKQGACKRMRVVFGQASGRNLPNRSTGGWTFPCLLNAAVMGAAPLLHRQAEIIGLGSQVPPHSVFPDLGRGNTIDMGTGA